MTDNNDRTEVEIPVTEQLWTCERVFGDRPKQLVLRGERGHLADVLLTALAEVLGDTILAKLSADDLIVALHTLGETGAHGLDEDLRGELSEPQKRVLDQAGSLWASATWGDDE